MKSLLINLATIAFVAALIYLTWHVSEQALRIILSVVIGVFYCCYRIFVGVLQASQAEEEEMNARLAKPEPTRSRPQRIEVG